MPELTTSACPADSSSGSSSACSSPCSSSPSTPTSASSAPVRNLVTKVAALSAGAIAYVPPSVSDKVVQYGSPLVDAADFQIRAASDRIHAAQQRVGEAATAVQDKVGLAKAKVVERIQATKQQAVDVHTSTSEAVSARVEFALAAVKQSMETLQSTINQFRPAAKSAAETSADAPNADASAPAPAPTKSLVQTKLSELQTSFAGAVEKAQELRCASTQRVVDLYSSAVAATTNATANASAMTNAQAQLALAKVAEVQAKVQELIKSLTARKEKAVAAEPVEGSAASAEVPAQ